MDQEALEILTWYRDLGVDIALQDSPVDQFAQATELAKQVQVTGEKGQPKPPLPERQPLHNPAQGHANPAPVRGASTQRGMAPPDPKTIEMARELAKSAPDLETLKGLITAFEGCNLKLTAKNTVFADGNPDADIMLIGEAPGADEDVQGLPFVGRSGQFLDRILEAIGQSRESVYITNIIPWRPPGNRTPTHHEIEICRPFAERHMELIAPKVIILLGNVAAKTMMGTKAGIMSLRGNWQTLPVNGSHIPVMPTLHPAYLLRTPSAKGKVWQDFLEVRRKYNGEVAR